MRAGLLAPGSRTTVAADGAKHDAKEQRRRAHSRQQWSGAALAAVRPWSSSIMIHDAKRVLLSLLAAALLVRRVFGQSQSYLL